MVQAPSTRVGGDKVMLLNVVDERPRKTLGTVAPGNMGADVSLQGDLVRIVADAINQGLAQMAFKPTLARGTQGTELRVEIRNLDYTAIKGFWAGTLRIDAGLKAVCVREGQRPYEKLHTGEHVETVQVVQSQEANSKYVSSAVSSAVNSLLADKELTECLAKPAA